MYIFTTIYGLNSRHNYTEIVNLQKLPIFLKPCILYFSGLPIGVESHFYCVCVYQLLYNCFCCTPAHLSYQVTLFLLIIMCYKVNNMMLSQLKYNMHQLLGFKKKHNTS